MKYKVIDKEYGKRIFIEDNPEIKYVEFDSIVDAEHYIKTGEIGATEPIDVFTDGACSNNGNNGAKAGIGVFFGKNDPRNTSRKITGKQTNNRAELLAIIEVFNILKKEIIPGKGGLEKQVNIYTDSQYSIDALTKWSINWEKNEWKKKNNTKILNLEIIKEGYQLLKEYPNVKLIHVRGHTKKTDRLSLGNNEADKLATKCIEDNSKKKKNRGKSINYYFSPTGYQSLSSSEMKFNDVGLRTDHKWPGSAYDSD